MKAHIGRFIVQSHAAALGILVHLTMTGAAKAADAHPSCVATAMTFAQQGTACTSGIECVRLSLISFAMNPTDAAILNAAKDLLKIDRGLSAAMVQVWLDAGYDKRLPLSKRSADAKKFLDAVTRQYAVDINAQVDRIEDCSHDWRPAFDLVIDGRQVAIGEVTRELETPTTGGTLRQLKAAVHWVAVAQQSAPEEPSPPVRPKRTDVSGDEPPSGLCGGHRTYPCYLGGAGLAVLAGAGVVGILANDREGDADAVCPERNGCENEADARRANQELARAKGRADVATGLLVGGGLLTAGSLVWYLLAEQSLTSSGREAPTVGASCASDGCQLWGQGHF